MPLPVAHSKLISLLFGIFILAEIESPSLSIIASISLYAQMISISSIPLILLAKNYRAAQMDRGLSTLAIIVYAQLVLFLFLGFFMHHQDLILQRSLMILMPTLALICAIALEKSPLTLLMDLIGAIYKIVLTISFLAIVTYSFGLISIQPASSTQTLSIGPLSITQSIMGIAPLFRTGGLFGNPNRLAHWIVSVLPFLFYFYSAGKVGKTAFMIQLLVLLAAMIITFSRTGLGLFLSTSIIYLIMSSRSFPMRILIAALGAVCAIAAIFAFMYLIAGTSRAEAGLSGRDEIWNILLMSISDHPFFGVGFGLSREEILLPGGTEFSAHNFYLEHISEVGIVGSLLFLLFLASLLYLILIQYRRSKNNSAARLFGRAILTYVFVMLVFLMTESGLYRFSATHFFFFFAAICTASHRFWRPSKILGPQA